jgi:membrane protein involved in colicin uptake
MAEVDYAARLKDTGRNDDCPCGSGKKYKKCHLPADQEAEQQARAKKAAEEAAKAKTDADAKEKAEKDAKENGTHVPEVAVKSHEHNHGASGQVQHGAKANQSHKPMGAPRKMV